MVKKKIHDNGVHEDSEAVVNIFKHKFVNICKNIAASIGGKYKN